MANNNLDLLSSMFKSTSPEILAQKENEIHMLPIDSLISFRNHPFHMYNREKEMEMIESIKTHGILSPIIVRPKENGYEILAGHNRVNCARLAGLTKIPAYIRDVDDDEATLIMVETNFQQRQEILPSEKAFAYKMQLEAIKRQGNRTDLTSCHHGTKLRADETISKNSNDSARTIQRYIRLTYLISELLDLVDEGKLSFIFGVELSYLEKGHQQIVSDMIFTGEKLNKSIIEELRKFQRVNKLTDEKVEQIILNTKTAQISSVSIPASLVKKYNLPQDKIEREMIIKEALELYYEGKIQTYV